MNINAPTSGKALALPFTKGKKTDALYDDGDMRLPLVRLLPDNIRNHFIAMSGEFVGTVLFLFFALSGAQVANSIPSSAGLTVEQTGSNPQQLQYIALCFGFSLAVNAWVFFRISGGLFNPAVTLGMCLIGALPWIRGTLLFVTQILGGIASSALVSCMFPGSLNVQTSLGGGTSIVQGLFIEMFLTAELVFTIFMLAAEKHKGTFIAPVGIGLALFVAELSGVYFTGGSLNPARSFGPAVVDRQFDGYHWIYWVGPMLGSIVAAGFYKFIKALEYETANPGQDSSHQAKVEKKKNLLMAAGIGEHDAQVVAKDLAATGSSAGETGGMNGTVMANGQGRMSQDVDTDGMYGSRFLQQNGVGESKENLAGGSDGSETAIIMPQRPGAITTPSHVGRLNYLREAARRSSNTAVPQRLDSPAMATKEEIYAPLDANTTEGLGHMIDPNEPRFRYSRTASSGV
ncbi:aquaporin [Lophiostoma macrostomum CBS 122681]|uniref:Aquaporin n=1 Tax=Lophiostoma macrostomum CBS 122681 TaxID=1314788 RepID=A0A6A6T2C2_9PLEO|nr:aquaporin [Lophiostoma macrostomum CBS 122681]